MKVTLLFPGQGSQYVGMGKNIEGHEGFNLFSAANDVLGFSLSSICFEGPDSDLMLTKNTQPAILTYSVALYRKLEEILKQKNVTVERVLGHSVGEYAALVAAGSLSFEEAVSAVHNRGKFMQEATPEGIGSMYAIMRLPSETVKEACTAVGIERVMPANYNGPDQTVISGEKDACEEVVNWLTDNIEEKFRAIELKVSAPFHSALMKSAEEKLCRQFDKYTFNNTKVPYIANIDANEYPSDTSGEVIKKNLLEQVCGSVMWTQSIGQLDNDTICIEVGPRNVLQGLVKKINPNIKVVSLDKENGFEELNEVLK